MLLYQLDDLYPQCFLCGERVLKIVGQDIGLPWDALKDEDKHLELYKLLGFGEAHIACVQKSEWAELIARRKQESIAVQWRSVYTDDTLAIFETALNTISIIRNDGWFVKFNSTADRQQTDSGIRVAVKTKYDINKAWSPLMARLYNELFATNKDNPYSFLNFIDAFNVKDKLIDLAAVKDGKIYSHPIEVVDEYGTIHKRIPASGTLVARAEYDIYIPDEVWQLIPSESLT